MPSRRLIALALLALINLPAGPAAAQDPTPRALDYWVGVGRFQLPGQPETPADPVDLSGDYQVDGANPGEGAGSYTTTMTLKRDKTLETPQGGKINLYKVRYQWPESPTDGVALHIGHRLYLAYGNENIMLTVGAPYTLTEAEQAAGNRARGLEAKAAEANRNSGKYTYYYTKGTPWFAGVKWGDEDFVFEATSAPLDATSHFFVWASPQDQWGTEFYFSMPDLAEGDYDLTGWMMKKGNQSLNGSKALYSGNLVVAPRGEVFATVQTYRQTGDPVEIHGALIKLDDGTVAGVMGGSDSTGVAVYEYADGKLVGRWCTLYGSVLSSETLTPDAKAAAKCAEAFAAN